MTAAREILEFTPTVPRLFPAARSALALPPVSHRGAGFGELAATVRERLRRLAGGSWRPVFAAGTGTWANEVMAWNILPGCRRALVVANGEFGERLFRQCLACRADTLKLEMPWGAPFERPALAAGLAAHPEVDRIFAVATETSCGINNDLALLDELAAGQGAWLALDGVSAVGALPEVFGLRRLRCVTASSGKALAALPGIALLFLAPGFAPEAVRGIPDSLDLAQILAAEASPGGVRNTLGSPQLACLAASLEALEGCGDYPGMLAEYKRRIVAACAGRGIAAWPGNSSAMATTFFRPAEARWRRLLREFEAGGVRVYWEPEYLRRRRLFQVVTMGDFTAGEVDRLIAALESLPKK